VNNAILVLDSDESFKRHKVTRSLEGPSPIVRVDADLLKGVFRNLLLNAAQAMPGAGSIDIRVVHKGSMCHVTVADTGPGVAAELAERLFQPFVTNKRGGTGLGLSTSRHIVRLHGGDLSLVQSTERGAMFLVTVPIDTGAP